MTILNNYTNHKVFTIAFLIIIISILIYFEINNSSVGMYCQLAPIGCDSGEILFKSRPIRSDEWLVGTPYFVAQQQSNLQKYSDLLGEKQAISLLSGAALSHWSSLFRPTLIAQFFLDIEKALSFHWLMSYVIFFSVFYLLLRLWKIEKLYSAIISLSIIFTPFFQWWSVHIVTAYPLALLVLFIFFVQDNKISLKSALVYTFSGIYLISVTMHQLYPPFQIPLFYLILFISFAFLKKIDNFNKKKLIFSGVIILFISLITSLFLFNKYFKYFSSDYSAITNSSYPGKRIAVGGDFELSQLLYGFYNLQLLNDSKPLGDTNQSEAAGFFNYFLFIIPLIIANEYLRFREKRGLDPLMLALLIYILFIGLWMAVGYPGFVAKYSLLEMVTAKRAHIGLGLSGLLVLIYFTFSYEVSNRLSKLKYLTLATFFITVLVTGFYLKERYPLFISNDIKILLISLVSTGILYASIFKRKLIFCTLFLLFSLTTSLSVHPIRSGLSPILNSEFSQMIKRINSELPGQWVVYDSNLLSPLIYANNIRTLSGSYLYPQESFWSIFDPDHNYLDIWNRYGNAAFTSNNSNDIVFTLLQQDAYLVHVNPCNNVFDKFKNLYFVRMGPMDESCLDQVDVINNENGSIFVYLRQENR